MILHAKQNKLVKDVNELKQRLSVYFDPETMKPLPLYDWFNLRLLEIFEIAFERLPILRRIWIRLTGKYESFRSRYVGQSAIRRQERATSGTSTATASGGSAEDEGISGKSFPNQDRGDHGDQRRTAAGATPHEPPHATNAVHTDGHASASTSKKPVLSAEAEAKKRAYSKKQVDSAWEEFGSSIKKDD